MVWLQSYDFGVEIFKMHKFSSAPRDPGGEY